MNKISKEKRSLGIFGATGVGVGAIVGGGILALAGVAFSTTGPSTILAFALNGVIAFITALSYAEMSTTFPESGGTYTFAKKVLTVEAAFAVGWVVWFASIVAAVMYALGLASFGAITINTFVHIIGGTESSYVLSQGMVKYLALIVTVFFALRLIHGHGSGGNWVNIVKVGVFGILILSGFVMFLKKPHIDEFIHWNLFFPNGATGLFQAMGYTFIALQGFDLIAAVAGEIRNPTHVIPRAMLLSLALALAIYIPFLFIISTVGVPANDSILSMSIKEPETVVATAVQNYLGRPGYWFVIVAAILSMASALYTNLLAASRVTSAMARDRTLPHLIGKMHPRYGTPNTAILITALAVVIIIILITDFSVAGAASSLIFLITFALVHGMNILVHLRSGTEKPSFKVPFFPIFPIVGIISCVALALFQGFSVPSAGLLASIWLAIGVVLFFFIFERRARSFDASLEGLDPQLARLRGQNPLVLVPIANPANAEAMITVANALAPPYVGRVLLLNIVNPSNFKAFDAHPPQSIDAQPVLSKALSASISTGLYPEALTTIAQSPWTEITRVSNVHRCQSILLGLSTINEKKIDTRLENLINSIDSDVVLLRAPRDWRVSEVRRILVPVGGRGDHDELRARLLGSLCRISPRQITFLKVIPEQISDDTYKKVHQQLSYLAQDEASGQSQVKLILSDDVENEILRYGQQVDMIILGLHHSGRNKRMFGKLTLRIVNETSCVNILISQKN